MMKVLRDPLYVTFLQYSYLQEGFMRGGAYADTDQTVRISRPSTQSTKDNQCKPTKHQRKTNHTRQAKAGNQTQNQQLPNQEQLMQNKQTEPNGASKRIKAKSSSMELRREEGVPIPSRYEDLVPDAIYGPGYLTLSVEDGVETCCICWGGPSKT